MQIFNSVLISNKNYDTIKLVYNIYLRIADEEAY